MIDSVQAGAVLYAKDMARMCDFYARVAGLRAVHAEHDHVVLESPRFQLVVVAIPAPLATTIRTTTPPRRREDCALKLVLAVASIAAARAAALPAGGKLDDPEHEWRFCGARVCDGHDPEGNVVQFRESAGGSATQAAQP